jgi:hypothetical protein
MVILLALLVGCPAILHHLGQFLGSTEDGIIILPQKTIVFQNIFDRKITNVL